MKYSITFRNGKWKLPSARGFLHKSKEEKQGLQNINCRNELESILVYPLRKEADISGENYSTIALVKLLSELGFIIHELPEPEIKTSSFWSSFSLRRFTELRRISENNLVSNLIVKIPTASHLFIVPFLTKGFKGRVVVLIDGIMWITPRLKTSIHMFLHEPIITSIRVLLNNPLWCTFSTKFQYEIVVSSKTQEMQFEKYLNAKSCVCVITNYPFGISLNPMPLKAIVIDDITFGYIGHTYPIKGVHVLSKAFRMLANDLVVPSLKLALSGRGPSVPKQAFKNCNVSFSGKVDRDEYYNSVDCLIFPYLAEWGTNVFPSVLLESLARGIPIITSDLPLCRELFSDANNIYFVRPDDALALAEKVKEIYHRGKAIFTETSNEDVNHKGRQIKARKGWERLLLKN
jgi:glycosyltransferase involved in cell wall biosynthesis